jgi:hypothetical protein
MVKYNKDFQDVPSALTFLTSDGKTGASILNGKIKAEGSKFDGLDATEGNLMKALDTTGYSMPKTNINDYRFPEAKQVPEKMPNYGDMIPRIPENYKEPSPMKKENIPFNPIFRPGMDPMGMPNRRPSMMPNNMVQNRGNNKTLVKLATVNRLFPGLIG